MSNAALKVPVSVLFHVYSGVGLLLHMLVPVLVFWGISTPFSIVTEHICILATSCKGSNFSIFFSSVEFSHSIVSSSLWPSGLQHTRPPCPSPTPEVYTNSSPWSRWCHPTILASVTPSPPVFNLSQHQGLFKWVSSLYQVAKVLEFQLQHQSFQWIFRTDFL